LVAKTGDSIGSHGITGEVVGADKICETELIPDAVGGKGRSTDVHSGGDGKNRIHVNQHDTCLSILPFRGMDAQFTHGGSGVEERVADVCQQVTHLRAIVSVAGCLVVQQHVRVKNLVVHIENAVFEPGQIVIRGIKRNLDAGTFSGPGFGDEDWHG
jgi:hypothetical protein